ncbi:hypothetical protein GQ457_09G014980 [Hibiscus cannabinus]
MIVNDIFSELFRFSNPFGGMGRGFGDGDDDNGNNRMKDGLRSFGSVFGNDIFSLFGEGRPMTQGPRKTPPMENALPYTSNFVKLQRLTAYFNLYLNGHGVQLIYRKAWCCSS